MLPSFLRDFFWLGFLCPIVLLVMFVVILSSFGHRANSRGLGLCPWGRSDFRLHIWVSFSFRGISSGTGMGMGMGSINNGCRYRNRNRNRNRDRDRDRSTLVFLRGPPQRGQKGLWTKGIGTNRGRTRKSSRFQTFDRGNRKRRYLFFGEERSKHILHQTGISLVVEKRAPDVLNRKTGREIFGMTLHESKHVVFSVVFEQCRFETLVHGFVLKPRQHLTHHVSVTVVHRRTGRDRIRK
mmetsp:Transcript_47585/g.123255  ORF Transcript_47585/g.123255 Transcript_47585/m.123255 type:complete len:239 (+) Transcript_47585:5068-5784(+)